MFDRFKKGDTLAYESIYKEYFYRMYLLSKKIVGNVSVAEDITQQVFLVLWEKRKNIVIEQNLGGYLARSIYNSSLQYIKKNNIHIKHHTQIYDEAYDSDESYIEQQVKFAGDDERIIQLRKNINLLPDQCREILMMSKFKDKNKEEIAEYFNISARTVENQLYIGLKKLRELMKK